MNERDLFLSALEIDDPAARRAHLQSICADDASLLARVESLLASHESRSLFLQTPAVEQLGTGAAEGTAATTCVAPGSGDRADDEERQQSDHPVDETPLGFLQPSARPDSLGRLAHYEILEVIGRGAFGTVLRAFDDKLQRVVAIKVLAPELATTSPPRKRFLREAQASAQIRHENVVSVYDVHDKPIPFLVMEYIPGQTLQQRLDELGPLELLDVLRLGIQIAKGLAAAHAHDLIHRDIKPGNILLETTLQDRVKITDFGLARAADDASMTQSGMIAGTPMYMAPEQALGLKLDQRADLFSLGSVLYQMVSGRAPFRAPSTLAVLKRLTEETPRPIQEIIPETPDWLCDVISKLHAKNPDERFQSAREVADLLEQHLADWQRPDKVVAPRNERPRDRNNQGYRWGPGLVLLAIHAAAICVGAVAMLVVFPRFIQTFNEFGLPLPATTRSIVNLFNFVMRGGWLLLPLLLAIDAALLIGLRAIPKVGPKFGYLWFTAVLVGMLSFGALSVIGLFQPLMGLQRELSQPQSTQLSSPAIVDASSTFNPPPTAVAPFDAEQAKAHQKAWADHLGVPVEMTNSIGIQLRLIPPGEFLMGETQEASDRLVHSLEQAGADEFSKFVARFSSPQHRVRITQPSYLGACEVTVGQYRRFIEQTKYIGTMRQLGVGRFDWTSSAAAPNPEDRAVLGVSWDDAKAFCKWLSQQEGVVYDLPSEAQWEYACRAGTMTAWSFGDDATGLDEHAIFGRASFWPTELVGSKTPNPFGLFDMHGNADEWCLDWHHRDFYAQSPIEDPICANDPKDKNSGRVARGGTAVSAAWWTRSSTRAFDFPATPNTPKGFRVTLVGSANMKKVQAHESAQKTAESDATQPPAGPKLIKLRSFTPGKDKLPIALRTGGKEVVTVEGDAWRIENSGQGGNFNVMIAQLLDGIPEDGVVVFRAKVRVEATEKTTWGSLMFGGANELFSNWDQWPEALSRFDITEAQWVEKEARLPAAQFRKSDPPAIYLYIGLHNTGVLWIKEAELLHLPAAPASIGQVPPAAPFDAAQAKEHQKARAPKSTANAQPIKLRSFTPGKDKLPIALRTDGKEVVTVDGDAWRIENSGQGGNFNVIIAQILEDIPHDGVLIFRAQVKVAATEKTTWGHLGFGGANHQFISWEQWPGVLTRFNITDTQWVEKEVRHPVAECHETDPPAVYLYTGLHNTGVMWIKDVELLHLPAAAKRNK